MNLLTRYLTFWTQKGLQNTIRFNFILIAFQVLIITLKYNQLPPEIGLFFANKWGTTRLSEPSGLFLLPIISSIVFFLNTTVASSLFLKDSLLSKILLHSTLLSSILSSYATLQILRVNTNLW